MTLSVYAGDPGDLTQIVCNDDTFGGQSRVLFEAAAGTTYFIMVGSFGSGPGGNLVFSMVVTVPPLDLELTIDPKGSVDTASGTAVVSGTVFCSRPVFVDIGGELRRRVARRAIVGSFFTDVSCDAETPWSVMVVPKDGAFKGGPAVVTAAAQALDRVRREVVTDNTQPRVKLTGR